MRIIFLSAAEGFGGGEKYLSLIIPALRLRGYEVYLRVLSRKPPNQLIEYIDNDLSIKSDDIVIFNGVGSLYHWGRKFSNHGITVFIQLSSLADNQANSLKRILRPFLVKYFGRTLDLTIRVCNSVLPDNFLPFTRTVYLGVPYKEDLMVKERQGEDFQLAMVGTLNNNKNQMAALQLLTRLPKHIKLKIIGDGPIKLQLDNFAKLNNIDDRVTWTGFVSDPTSELHDSHVLLMLSQIEGLPFAALEAMSLGIPVISTNVGGLPELIDDGVDGYLVNANNLSELDDLVLRLDNNEILRQQLGNNARKKIRTHFTVELMVTNFIDAISETLSRIKSTGIAWGDKN